MPPPSVTSMAARGCNGTGAYSSTPPFTKCVPLSSVLIVWGNYMYGSDLMVGGVLCNAFSNAQSLTCWLPLIPDYTPGHYYDVQLVNSAGAVTLSGLVSFVGGPVLFSMTLCVNWDSGASQLGGHCQPGASIAVYGVGFYPDDSLQIIFTQLGSPAANFSCLQPAYINSTTLSCTLPSAADSSSNVTRFLGYGMYLQLAFNRSTVLSNRVYVSPLDWPNPPLVSYVSGSCAASDGALAVTGCAMGSLLTLQGSNLNGSDLSVYSTGPAVQSGTNLGWVYLTCVVQSVSPSAISCLLPAPGDELLGSLEPGVSYVWSGSLMDSAGRYRRLNAFSVAFAPAASALTSSSGGGGGGGGGGSNTSVILIGVLVPALVLLLLLLSVLLWRRWMLTKRANSGNGAAATAGDRFEHFTDVEMR